MDRRSASRLLVASVAPGPYTVWALRRRQPTICGVLRRHKVLFVAAWAWFLIHVMRKVS